jgi:hypothetical protein
VAGTARDLAPFHDGGCMVDFLLKNESRMKLRQGEATRGMWRILDGKGGKWCVFMSEAPKVGTTLVGPYGTSIDYVLAHAGFMRSRKLSSLDDR